MVERLSIVVLLAVKVTTFAVTNARARRGVIGHFRASSSALFPPKPFTQRELSIIILKSSYWSSKILVRWRQNM